MRFFAAKKNTFTDKQIAFGVRRAKTGIRAAEVCRKADNGEAIFYNWKKKTGGMGVSKVRRLKHPGMENRRFKRMVAGLSLYKKML